ncbi:hypothetical protein [Mycolicibacterium phocaicum]|uniref:hypothetical protein n=1 Tax=Mycolicibacterium phocaicum TaxID=319706 RepID=UPI001CFB75C6|nr:hypothetical protein [Mycolicibacterium phocaicum]UCZ59929.1 hypothetical protein LHJ73_25205 [Mycolicibacterium phocaicum]
MSETEDPEAPPISRLPVAVDLQPKWLAPASLGIAVIALGVAVWALVSPPRQSSPSVPGPTEQQVNDAKARACAAFTTVRTAVALQTHTELGPEPVAVTAVTAVSRLAMSSGAQYLQTHLDAATPADLAAAIREFAVDLQDISMYGQAGISGADPAQASRLKAGEAVSMKIAGLCK